MTTQTRCGRYRWRNKWGCSDTCYSVDVMKSESDSHSVTSDSLQPHGLYSPRNSPGQNTGVDSCSLLQGIFTSQGSNPGYPHCRQILYQLSHQRSLMLGKFEDKRRGQQRMRWLDSITTSMDMNSSQLWEIVKHREALCAEVHGVAKSWTWLDNYIRCV